jgi:hypothetical protein
MPLRKPWQTVSQAYAEASVAATGPTPKEMPLPDGSGIERRHLFRKTSG